jgi:membrane protein
MGQAPAHAPTRDLPAAGGTAARPTQIPARGWKEVVLRVKEQITKDNVSIVAAGCAFYALLALFPAITALVSIYGLVADPASVEAQMNSLQQVAPTEAFGIIRDQVHAVASKGSTTLGWSAGLAIVLALYSASSGVKSLFTALNIAYEEEESRGFLRYNLTALAFTLAAVVGVALGLAVIVGVPAVLGYLPLGPLAEWTIRIVSWTLLFVLVATAISATYRIGPSRAPADWRWVTPGSIAAALLWIVASLAFSFYAANFASYNETYGTLGGVIILLMWLWLSSYVVMLGAELNSELELQTVHDTTTGPERPRGQRQAYVADHTASERSAGDR